MEIGLENEFWGNFNQAQPRPHGTLRKRLFPTPGPAKSKIQRTSTSPSLLTTSTITNQFLLDQNPPVTPQVVRGSGVSARKRPSVVDMEGTPSVRKRIVCKNRDGCHARQAADLTAWLNYELLHPLQPSSSSSNGLGNFPQHVLSQDNDFLNQLSEMHRVFHCGELYNMRLRLVNDLRELPIDSNVDFSPSGNSRRLIVSHILLNYHPAWLLPALCVMFDTNLAIDLDTALYTARNTNPSAQDHFTLMQFLEDVLYTAFLAPHRHTFSNVAQTISSDATSPVPPMVAKKNFHRLILERILELVFLLDFSGVAPEIFIHADPPLFRHDSSITSSKEFVSVIEKSLFESDSLQSFLRRRQYSFRYRMSKCEARRDLHISHLAQDLRDGIRLCKLAALFTKDRSILTHVRVPSQQNMQKEIHDIRLHNIHLAMRTLLKFAYNTTKEAVEWYASPMEVATGNLPTILPFLWQLVALWRDSVLFNTSDLSAELEIVKDEFRKHRRKVPRMSQSPTAEMCLNELSPSIQSPSNLCIYEKCSNPNSALLLEWSAVVCGMYGLVIRDFSASFRDGTALSLMLHFYHPEIINSEEIVHVAAAEVRAPEAAEAEMALAQNNFDVFVNRLRILGAFPNIHISAASALGSSSLTTETQQSFGRLMDIVLSYLFRHIVLQRASDVQERVQALLEESKNSVRKDLAARLIAKSLKHLHVLKRLERMGATPKSYTSRSAISPSSNRSPVHRSGAKPSAFSPSKPPRTEAFSGRNSDVFGEYSRNVYSASKPPKSGYSKLPSFLSPSKRHAGHSKKNTLAFSPLKSPSLRSDPPTADTDPICTIRRLKDDTARRIRAATVIANCYKAWRTRREIDDRKRSTSLLQACALERSANKTTVDRLPENAVFSNDDRSLTRATTPQACSPLDALQLAKILSPVNSGMQLTLDVLPRVQDHMKAIERFICRMEREEGELSNPAKVASTLLKVTHPEEAQRHNVAPESPSPHHSVMQSPLVQDPRTENPHRRTWRELAISAAAGGVSYLADAVFKKLAEISSNVDSTLHEGSSALYMSARKPPRQPTIDTGTVTQHVAAVKERATVCGEHNRPILAAPLDVTSPDVSTCESDDDSFSGMDNICTAQGLFSKNLVERCNELKGEVIEISVTKDRLSGMLSKMLREEMDDGASHRQSISFIEQQLSELNRTSEKLFDKVEYFQELSSKCEKAFTMVDSLGSENRYSRSSRGSMGIFEEYEKSIRMIMEERLAARLSDAEEAFTAVMSASGEMHCRRKEIESKLENVNVVSKKIAMQFENESDVFNGVIGDLNRDYISSCEGMESVVGTAEQVCNDFLNSPEPAVELSIADLQSTIPDLSEIGSSYSLLMKKRLCERLSQAEDRFLEEYRECRLSSLKHWLNWMGYVMLLRELKESSKLDIKAYDEQMEVIDESLSRADNEYRVLSDLEFHPSCTNNPQLDLICEEVASSVTHETPLQISFVDAVLSHEQIFGCVLAQRLEERLEIAKEMYLQEMCLRKARRTAAWSEQKYRELAFRSSEEKLSSEERVATAEYDAIQIALVKSSFDWDSHYDHCADTLRDPVLDRAMVFDDTLEDIESVDELGATCDSSILESSHLAREIQKDRLEELLGSAQERYENFMVDRGMAHVEEWLQKTQVDLQSRENFTEVDAVLCDEGAERQKLDDLLNEVEKEYIEAIRSISYLSRSVVHDSDPDEDSYTSCTTSSDTEIDCSLRAVLENSEVEFKDIWSRRLCESLERAYDRFKEDVLQCRLRNINSWLKRRNAELSFMELDAELNENVKSYEVQMQNLEMVADSLQTVYGSAVDNLIHSEVEKRLLDDDSESCPCEALSTLVSEDKDEIRNAYHNALLDCECLEQELLEVRFLDRHCHAQQEFEKTMSLLRCTRVDQWLKKAEYDVSIRELDEELNRMDSLPVAESQIASKCVTFEYSDSFPTGGVFSSPGVASHSIQKQNSDDDPESVYEALKEFDRLMEEFCTVCDDKLPATLEKHVNAEAVLTESESQSTEVTCKEIDSAGAGIGECLFAENGSTSGIAVQAEAASRTSTRNNPLEICSRVEKTTVREANSETAICLPLPESTIRTETVGNSLSNSLSIFISPSAKISGSHTKERDNDDFVSLSSFATSKNSSRQSTGNDFVSLSSLGTGRFSSAMDGKASQSVFGGRYMGMPYSQEMSASFGEQNDYNGGQLMDTVSPGIALWRIGDTPLRNREEVLGRLSAELDAIGRDMSPNGIDLVMGDKGSASRLQGVMRRISMATGSPFIEDNLNMDWGQEENYLSFVGLVRMVLVVMRSCVRSDEYIALVRLGMKIVKDLCIVQQRICDVIQVEESVDVISTCVQFYRDDENIFNEGVEILHAISKDADGILLLKASKDVIFRLARVKEVMIEHLSRSQRMEMRLRQANAVKDVLARRRGQKVVGSLAEEIRKVHENDKLAKEELSVAVQKLQDVVQNSQ